MKLVHEHTNYCWTDQNTISQIFFPKYIAGVCIVKGAIIFKGLDMK